MLCVYFFMTIELRLLTRSSPSDESSPVVSEGGTVAYFFHARQGIYLKHIVILTALLFHQVSRKMLRSLVIYLANSLGSRK